MDSQVVEEVAQGREAEHGEVFTRRWVVDLILDLSGYTADRDLADRVVIEPSCGGGAFLVPMVERLAESALAFGRDLSDCDRAIVATDLLDKNVEASRNRVTSLLGELDLDREDASRLAATWITQRDFLLEPPTPSSADFVVGNPPYIRLEAVPDRRSKAYREICSTMGGRADVYIGFFEQGLKALVEGGTLGFICADRWMRNSYGSKLRAYTADNCSAETIISMHGVDAFDEEVDAYPAITVFRKKAQGAGPLVIHARPEFNEAQAVKVSGLARNGRLGQSRSPYFEAARLSRWFEGEGGWPLGSPERLATILELESRFAPLEDANTGTKVGIGLATGADRVFIVEAPGGVEAERLLPLATVRDISSGKVKWGGRKLVNPWDENGLVDMRDWPGLYSYLEPHRALLSDRHTAKPGRWHKTIDRVIEGLADRPKLYIPDFKEKLFPVLDEGGTYPHHNLYWITSDSWDLRVLGGILMSEVANLFVEAYSVRMRGGYLRFQAQYLRRIRVPDPGRIDSKTASSLARAFDARDTTEASRLTLGLYELEELPA